MCALILTACVCVADCRCIGFYNYKYFLLFLGWSAVTCLYESGLLFRFLLADSLDHSARLYVHGKLRFRSPSLQVRTVSILILVQDVVFERVTFM